MILEILIILLMRLYAERSVRLKHPSKDLYVGGPDFYPYFVPLEKSSVFQDEKSKKKGEIVITVQNTSNKVWDIEASNKNLIYYPRHGGPNQDFIVKHLARDVVIIEAAMGLCITYMEIEKRFERRECDKAKKYRDQIFYITNEEGVWSGSGSASDGWGFGFTKTGEFSGMFGAGLEDGGLWGECNDCLTGGFGHESQGREYEAALGRQLETAQAAGRGEAAGGYGSGGHWGDNSGYSAGFGGMTAGEFGVPEDGYGTDEGGFADAMGLRGYGRMPDHRALFSQFGGMIENDRNTELLDSDNDTKSAPQSRRRRDLGASPTQAGSADTGFLAHITTLFKNSPSIGDYLSGLIATTNVYTDGPRQSAGDASGFLGNLTPSTNDTPPRTIDSFGNKLNSEDHKLDVIFNAIPTREKKQLLGSLDKEAGSKFSMGNKSRGIPKWMKNFFKMVKSKYNS